MDRESTRGVVLVVFIGCCLCSGSYARPRKGEGRHLTEEYAQNSQLAQSGALAELQAQQMEAARVRPVTQQQAALLAIQAHQNQKNKAQLAALQNSQNKFVPQTAAAVAAIEPQFAQLGSNRPLSGLNSFNTNPNTLQALNQQNQQQLLLQQQLLAQQQQLGGLHSFQQQQYGGIHSLQQQQGGLNSLLQQQAGFSAFPQQYSSLNGVTSGSGIQRLGLASLNMNFAGLNGNSRLGGYNNFNNHLNLAGIKRSSGNRLI